MNQFQKILHFIKYHNAFTIFFVIVFFGFGLSYAAIPEVRDSVYSSTETVVAVDNRAIVSADLDNFNFDLRISSVTEDETSYYAAYSYRTLAIEDNIWQSKWIAKTLTVNKEALGGKDLGLYVAEELGEDINAESYYLKEVQRLERAKGASRKVVAIEYSGLIGKLLDPEEKIIDGYNPVIPEPTPTPTPVSTPLPMPQITSTPEPLPDNPTSAGGDSVITPSPTPSVSPESTPLVSSPPEPSPASPSATPVLSPEPTPEPSSTPEPTPESTPETTPAITPEPTPESTPAPTPEPTPESTPEPTPIPEESPIP